MFVRDKDNEIADHAATDSVTKTGADAEHLAGQHEDAAEDAATEGETAGQTAAGDSADENEIDSDATTFSRTYVERLRRESANYRERASRADDYATRLHTALVAATGRLADASDLPFDAAHLDDEAALSVAIDELLAKKPHLATRQPFGDIGQGNRGSTSEPVNLADMLRARA